jgi:hypothetical protein
MTMERMVPSRTGGPGMGEYEGTPGPGKMVGHGWGIVHPLSLINRIRYAFMAVLPSLRINW